MKAEHIIRDWLVEHPDFIEEGLRVVEKEHYLPDDTGTSGFIDILCNDVYNNFVIVEIKRSDAAARQTFTEVLKYAQLIKNRYNARNGEIRIIIVSTHWNEIIQAFSTLCFESRFAIKGVQVYINEQTKIPETKEEVIPISSRMFSRKFMPPQILYLFRSREKRQQAHGILNQKMQQAGAFDYVTVDIEAPDGKPIPYPYGINAAFQQRSKVELLNTITLLNGEKHLDMVEEDFDNEGEYLNYLDQVFIAALEMTNYIDDVEAGYAEKFESATGDQNWKMSSIYRYGIFKTDPRYNDDLLIKELKGHDGNSSNKFVGFSESSQKERLQEIRLECQWCLRHTPHWADFIDHILSDLERSKEKFKVLVDIYNPDSIVTALYFTLIKGNPDYLPVFRIFVDYVDTNKTEVYIGEINSIGVKPRLKLFTSTNYQELSNEFFRLLLTPDNEMDAIGMGLRYSILKTVIIDDKEVSSQFVEIDENTIIPDTSNYTSIKEYIIKNKEALSLMITNYNRFSSHIL
jgi:hypothetical protein